MPRRKPPETEEERRIPVERISRQIDEDLEEQRAEFRSSSNSLGDLKVKE